MLRTRSPRYLVCLLCWRARSHSDWLHVFDSTYISDCRVNGASRGDFPCLQAHDPQDPRLSNRPSKAILGLPKNTYDPTWLSLQRNFAYGKEDYAFIHDNHIFFNWVWKPSVLHLYEPIIYMPTPAFVKFHHFYSYESPIWYAKFLCYLTVPSESICLCLCERSMSKVEPHCNWMSQNYTYCKISHTAHDHRSHSCGPILSLHWSCFATSGTLDLQAQRSPSRVSLHYIVHFLVSNLSQFNAPPEDPPMSRGRPTRFGRRDWSLLTPTWAYFHWSVTRHQGESSPLF